MARKAMLIDLKRCAGCYSCVVACQMQNNQKPGVQWNKLTKAEWGEYPDAHGCYIPHACMHCEDAPCVAACPTGASYTADDGVVLVNYEICLGCSDCVVACPYGARVINKNDAYFFNASSPTSYEAYGTQRINVAEKCTFCADITKDGRQPACVECCPGHARFFGDVTDSSTDVAKKKGSATQIGGGVGGFYYLTPSAMPSGMISSIVMTPVTPVDPVKPEDVKGNPSTGLIIGVGAAVVVAAGVGAGVAVNKKNKANK